VAPHRPDQPDGNDARHCAAHRTGDQHERGEQHCGHDCDGVSRVSPQALLVSPEGARELGVVGQEPALDLMQRLPLMITEHDPPPRDGLSPTHLGAGADRRPIVTRYSLVVTSRETDGSWGHVVVTAGGREAGSGPLTKEDFEALARFRFAIRRYLRFSEETVRGHGLAPQQYQLLLALKGFPGREWATVRELADRLQLRHHSVVELVNRAQGQGLVERDAHPDDARAVRVVLTENGEQILARLSALHRDELRRMDATLSPPTWHEEPDERDSAEA
jgi:DNA-binding MarR family transcriptional regulator